MTNPDKEQVLVIGPDGRPVAMPAAEAEASTSGTTEGAESEAESVAEMVEQPAKVMRIGTMIKQTLGRSARRAARRRQPQAPSRTSTPRPSENWKQGLAPELREELERLSLPFTDDSIPSDAELRIAQAQLVGWLEGLFHGIQTALFAQQMAARAQLEQMRQGALPPGMSIGAPHSPAHPDQQSPGTGQYL